MDNFTLQKRTKLEDNRQFDLKPKPSKEADDFQDAAIEAIHNEKQSILPIKMVNKSELERKFKASIAREKANMVREKNHFYVLDCETSRKKNPQPV